MEIGMEKALEYYNVNKNQCYIFKEFKKFEAILSLFLLNMQKFNPKRHAYNAVRSYRYLSHLLIEYKSKIEKDPSKYFDCESKKYSNVQFVL